MRTLRLTVAYDGTNYAGFQRQSNGLAVQQVLEAAFAPLVGDPTGRGPTVAGASRTDAGVHALAQIVSVNVDIDLAPSAIQRALNVRLPLEIRVLDAVDAPLGFHARFHATGKRYRYRIVTTPVLLPFERWFVWHAPGPRDVAAMRVAAARLTGRHDFASFQARGTAIRDTTRTLTRLEIVDRQGEITIEVDGNGFLRHMVRAIVGTLMEVGSGGRTPESMTEILAARDRAAAGPTVPASGLTLVGVQY
jgi:tRNA pseudouridine38-40 synthase